MVRIGFIGTGNMAQALIKSILAKKITDSNAIISSDKDPIKSNEVGKKLGINITNDNKKVVASSEVIFLAVKPQDIDNVLIEIKDEVKDKIIISIAAGVPISRIKSKIGDKKIVRVMPNTPCLVGEMAAGFAADKNLTKEEVSKVESILGAGGMALAVKEELLDAVTGVSGSGPAYVAYLVKAFADAGKENGLPGEVSYKLALKTFFGTAKMLESMQPEELMKMVTSPKGSTAAGREILENSDVTEIIKKTVKRTTERSKELGK